MGPDKGIFDLDVKDVDLHDLLRFLAEAGGVNIVIGDDVRGSVTVRLTQVRWHHALEVIVKLKGLKVVVDRGVYLVSRAD